MSWKHFFETFRLEDIIGFALFFLLVVLPGAKQALKGKREEASQTTDSDVLEDPTHAFEEARKSIEHLKEQRKKGGTTQGAFKDEEGKRASVFIPATKSLEPESKPFTEPIRTFLPDWVETKMPLDEKFSNFEASIPSEPAVSFASSIPGQDKNLISTNYPHNNTDTLRQWVIGQIILERKF